MTALALTPFSCWYGFDGPGVGFGVGADADAYGRTVCTYS